MLDQDQIAELKQQLADQIQHLPKEQREKAQEQIDSLSSDALEAMVSQQTSKKSILRMIIDKDVPAKIIEETQEALAVVEIKPVSKGHILVIPKKKVNSTIDPKVLSLARKIAKRAMLKLKPQGVEIQTETKFGEQVIDVIPYYTKPLSIVSPRYEAKEQELDEIYHLLKAKKRQKVLRQKPKKSQSYPTIKRRIP